MSIEKLATLDPNQVLDATLRQLHLKSDAALARHLSLQPPFLSKIRHSGMPIGASIVLRILEATDLKLSDLIRLAEQEEKITPEERRQKVFRNLYPVNQ